MSDLIDRQAAIDTIEDFPHGDVWNVESMEEMVDRIKQLPPIQSKPLQPWEVLVAQAVLPQSAEPKRGRWIGKYPVTSVCSECGFLIHDSKVKVFAFCPNCGAKMEVNHESN